MNIFLERFILPLLVALAGGLIWNPLKFNSVLRTSLFIAVVSLGAFVSYTLYPGTRLETQEKPSITHEREITSSLPTQPKPVTEKSLNPAPVKDKQPQTSAKSESLNEKPDELVRQSPSGIASNGAGSQNAIVSGNSGPVTINQTGSQGETRLNEQTLVEIATLVSDGEVIRQNYRRTKDGPQLVTDRTAWMSRVNDYLSKNVRQSIALQFKNVQKTGFEGCMAGYSIDYCGTYNDIGTRMNFLLNLK